MLAPDARRSDALLTPEHSRESSLFVHTTCNTEIADAEGKADNGDGTSVAQGSFNLIKNIVGVGLLSLPGSVAAGTGLGPALIVLALLGCYSHYTFSLVGEMCHVSSSLTFRELGIRAKGAKVATLIDGTCTLKTMATCLAFSLVISDSFTSILTSANAPTWLAQRSTVLLGVTALFLLPLCLMRDLRHLSLTSFLGGASMVFTAAFMGMRYADGSYAAGGRYAPPPPPPALSGGLALSAATPHLPFVAATPGWWDTWHVSVNTLVLICTLGTAYIAHYNAPIFYAGLAHRSAARLTRVSRNSFGVAIILFGAVTVFGYLTFGNQCDGFILNNYSDADPLATAARVAVGSSVILTYPLCFNAFRRGTCSLVGLPEPSAIQHTLLTLSLLGMVTGLAFLVTDVGLVNALGGSIFGATIIYIFPAALSLGFRARRLSHPSWAQLQLARFTLVAGVLFGVVGTIVTGMKYWGS